MHTGLAKVHRALVEAQEHVRSTIVEIADLVDFVLELHQIPEKRHQWIARVEGGRYESDSEQQPTPSPRIKPGNIAYAAVSLASEESRRITAHRLPVDRGIGD